LRHAFESLNDAFWRAVNHSAGGTNSLDRIHLYSWKLPPLKVLLLIGGELSLILVPLPAALSSRHYFNRMRGHLSKQGRLRKNWKQRLFVLDGDLLNYYKEDKVVVRETRKT
jgi:hypothetical protein